MLLRQKIGIGVAAALFGGLWLMGELGIQPFDPPNPALQNVRAYAHGWDEQRARTECRNIIVAAAKYGDAERPPYIQSGGAAGDFDFVWPRGSFHFRHGFNAMVPMAATCRGSLDAARIDEVTLNGESIFDRAGRKAEGR